MGIYMYILSPHIMIVWICLVWGLSYPHPGIVGHVQVEQSENVFVHSTSGWQAGWCCTWVCSRWFDLFSHDINHYLFGINLFCFFFPGVLSKSKCSLLLFPSVAFLLNKAMFCRSLRWKALVSMLSPRCHGFHPWIPNPKCQQKTVPFDIMIYYKPDP